MVYPSLPGRAAAPAHTTSVTPNNSPALSFVPGLGLTLLNGVQWPGHNPDSGPEDQFARLINGLDFSAVNSIPV